MSSLDQSTLVPASDDTALIARSDLIAEGEVDPQTLPAHEMQGATRILSTADIQASAQDTHPLPEGETKLPPPAPSQAEPTSPSAPSKKRSVGRSRREPVWARIMAIAAVLLAGVVFSYWLVKKPPAADEVVAKASEATVETDEISSPAVESSSTRAEKPLDAPPAPAEVVPAPEAPVMAVIGPDMGRVIGDALGGVEVPRRALPAVQEKVLQPETPIETAPRAAPVRPGSAGTAGAQPAPKPEPAPAPSRPVIQKEPPASPPAAVKPKPEPATAMPREEKKPQEVRPKPAAPKKPRKPARKPAKKKPKVDDLFDPF